MIDSDYICGYEKIDLDFVRRADAEFDRLLNDTVERVCHDKSVQIIGITGPTCSGKTTTAKKVIDYCKAHGIRLTVISLDDFFKDQFSKEDEIDPKTVDFDSPDTFDTEEFYSFVTKLFTEGEADKPIFDFITGDRDKYEHIVKGEGDVFLFEGIQLLYPQVESLLHKMNGRSIYLCAQSGIRVGDIMIAPTELRLMRRLVRDCNFRGAEVGFTLDLWASVRRNEDANIYPFAHKCDVMIDTTQPYELNILKPYLEKYLGAIPEGDEHYARARQILEPLSDIREISRNTLSENSLYREFV